MRLFLLCPIMALVGCAVTQSPPSPPAEPAVAAAPEPQETAPHSDAGGGGGPPLGILRRPHSSSSVGATREWVSGQSLGTVSQHVWSITALGPVTIAPGVVMPLISNGAITNGSWFPNNTLETVRLTIMREGRPVPWLTL